MSSPRAGTLAGRSFKVIVRAATEADLAGILEIYNDAVLMTTATADYEPQSMTARAEWLATRQRLGLAVLVAEEDGRILGWSSLSPYQPRYGYRFTAEDSVYIAANARGRGIGKALLTALIIEARNAGLHSLIAKIDCQNEVSIRLHSGCGFEQVGLLKQVVFKFDRWLDIAYLQLIL
jgi:phosphinothricin acetyltransferase